MDGDSPHTLYAAHHSDISAERRRELETRKAEVAKSGDPKEIDDEYVRRSFARRRNRDIQQLQRRRI